MEAFNNNNSFVGFRSRRLYWWLHSP